MKRLIQGAMILAMATAAAPLGNAGWRQQAGFNEQPAQAAASGEARGNIYRDGNSWIQETTGTLPAAKTIRVTTDAGAVRVHGGGQNNITYTIRKRIRTSSEERARSYFNDFRVSATHNGDTATFRGERSDERHGSIDFEIHTPKEVDLVKINTEGGSVAVSGISGRVEGSSGGGSIDMDDIGGAISADTGGGSVNVGSGGEMKLVTGGGSIHVRAAGGRVNATSGGGSVDIDSAKTDIKLTTGGGSITVGQCGGEAKVSTGGGSITLGDIGGAATLDTGGGSVHLNSAKGVVRARTGGGSLELLGMARGAVAESGGGSIVAEFTGDRSSFTESKIDTGAGDIVVYLQAGIAVNIRADVEVAFGHNIRSDFPELKVSSGSGDQYGPRELYAEGSLNGGGPLLKVRTSVGNISLRRGRR